MRLALLPALALLLTPGLSEAAEKRIAVSYFSNNSGDPSFDALGRGLAEMLITDLTLVEDIQVVERSRLNEVLGELELQKSAFIDPKTAVVVGKGVGASHILTGSFVAIDPEMRIDARLVEVATGKVVQAKAVTGAASEFFLLEKELAGILIEGMGAEVTARENARLGRVATEDFDAFLAWSEGLDAIDRGAMDEALEALRRALDSDERFALADQALVQLQERMRKLGARGQELRSSEARRFLKRLEDLAKNGGPYDVLQKEAGQVSSRLVLPASAEDLKTIASRMMDLELPEELRLGGPQGYLSLNEWALYHYFASSDALGHTTDALTYGEAFLERYPASTFAAGVRMQMNRVIEFRRKREATRSQIPTARARAKEWALWNRCYVDRTSQGRLAACRQMVETAHAAGVEHSERFEHWSNVAMWMGDLAEQEDILRLLRERYPRSEVVSDVLGNLERTRRNVENATEASAKLDAGSAFEKPYEILHPARELAGVSSTYKEAKRWFEEAMRRWPDQADIYGHAIRAADQRDDLSWAESVLKTWEDSPAANDPSIGTYLKTVAELSKRTETKRLAPTAAVELQRLGHEFLKIDQTDLAGETFVALAETYPLYPDFPAPQALQMAAGLFQQGHRKMDARAAYELIIERYPDSREAATARLVMEALPQ